ncbi:MAG: glycosyltransferase family 2 protein [Candidatus Sumerlaeia bacterium]
MTPDKQPFFSIIIVSLNGGEVIATALDALRHDGYARKEVIVVDNGSTDDLAEKVRGQYPEVRLIQSPINLGFAGGNNLGLREAAGDIMVLLNDDTEVRPGWLDAFARVAAEHDKWGIMGCKLLYPDGKTIQHAGGVIAPNGNTMHLGYEAPDDGSWDELIQCDYVTGAALAIRRELMDRLGMLDEKYFPIYFEETDYCWRARQLGYEVLYVPDSVVIHHESRTQARFSFRFVVRYTCGRFRFIVKNFTKRELLRAAKHEVRWWLKSENKHFRWPVVRAYLQSIPRLPGYWKARRQWRKELSKVSLASCRQ